MVRKKILLEIMKLKIVTITIIILLTPIINHKLISKSIKIHNTIYNYNNNNDNKNSNYDNNSISNCNKIDDTKDDLNSITKLNEKLSRKLEQPQTSSDVSTIRNRRSLNMQQQQHQTQQHEQKNAERLSFVNNKSPKPTALKLSIEELIYEISIKYKQIFRLSLISCHKASLTFTSTKQSTSSSSKINFKRMQSSSKSESQSLLASYTKLEEEFNKFKPNNNNKNKNCSNNINCNNNYNNDNINMKYMKKNIQKDLQPNRIILMKYDDDDKYNDEYMKQQQEPRLTNASKSKNYVDTAMLLRYFFHHRQHNQNFQHNYDKENLDNNHHQILIKNNNYDSKNDFSFVEEEVIDDGDEVTITNIHHSKNYQLNNKNILFNIKNGEQHMKQIIKKTKTYSKFSTNQQQQQNKLNSAESILIKVIPIDKILLNLQYPSSSSTLTSSTFQFIAPSTAKNTETTKKTLKSHSCHNNNNNNQNENQNNYNNNSTYSSITTLTSFDELNCNKNIINNDSTFNNNLNINMNPNFYNSQEQNPETINETTITSIGSTSSNNNNSIPIVASPSVSKKSSFFNNLNYESDFSSASSKLFDMITKNEKSYQVIVLDLMTCGIEKSKLILKMASDKKLFSSTYHWILIDDYPTTMMTTTSNRPGKEKNFPHKRENKFSSSKTTTINDVKYKSCYCSCCLYCSNDDNFCSEDKNENSVILNNTYSETASTSTDNKNSYQTIINPILKEINLKRKFSDKDEETITSINIVNSNNNNDDRNDENNNNHHHHHEIKNENINQYKQDKEQDISFIESFLSELNININTELILAKRYQHRNRNQQNKENEEINSNLNLDYYQLSDVWNPGYFYGGKLNITKIGIYTTYNGLKLYKWYKSQTTVIRRMNMNNVPIRSMIVATNKNKNQSLIEYLESRQNTHLDSMNHFSYALLSHVSDMFNFQLNLTATKSWGYLTNGTFDGMIGALTRNETDIGGSPIFFRLERAKVIHYTIHKTWISRPCFLFRHPKNWNLKGIIFLQPFDNMVWISISICCLIAIIIGWFLNYIEECLQNLKNSKTFIKNSNLFYIRTNQENNKNMIGKIKKGKTIVQVQQQQLLKHQKQQIEKMRSTIPIFATQDLTIRQHHKQNINNNNNNNNNNHLHNKYQNQSYNNIMSRSNWIPNKDFSYMNEPTTDTETVLWNARKRMNKKFKKNSNKRNIFEINNFFDMILLIIGMLCLQGVPTNTKLISGRIIIFSILLFAFLIYQYYSASIVGTLLTETPKTIKTLHNLVNSNLKLGIEDIVYNKDFFKRTTDSDAIKLYRKLGKTYKTDDNLLVKTTSLLEKQYASVTSKQSSIWVTPENGMKLVKLGGYAFHIDVSTAYKIISEIFTEKEICELSEIELFPPQKMVNIVQKNSPLRKVIMYGLRRTSESGLMDYQRKVWNFPKPQCTRTIKQNDLSVDMQTFLSAFFILIFGFAGSLIILTIEIIHKIFTTRTRWCFLMNK